MISFKCGSKRNVIFAPLRNVGKSKTIRKKILRRAVVARVTTCVRPRASQAVKSRGTRACLGAFLLFGSFYISESVECRVILVIVKHFQCSIFNAFEIISIFFWIEGAKMTGLNIKSIIINTIITIRLRF